MRCSRGLCLPSLLVFLACGRVVTDADDDSSSSGDYDDPTAPGVTAASTSAGSSTSTTSSTSSTTTASETGPVDTGCVPLQCGVDLICGTSADACGGQIDCGPCGEGTPVDGILPARMIADRTRGTLLATVQATSPMHPNELVVIDPATATVTTSVFVGSDPASLAISDDASTLWVSLEGSQEIVRVALGDGAPVAGESYGLPPTILGGAVAGPMVVLPGTTGSVAVSMHAWGYSPSFEGVAVFDDGVMRPTVTPGHTGAARLTSGPEGWLYGYNDLHTGFGFYTLEIGPSGPVSTEHIGLVDGFDTNIVYADGFVYGTDGAVIDVSDPATPDLAGTFPYRGAIIPDPENDRAIMASPPELGYTGITLRLLDILTFTQAASAGIATTSEVATFDFAMPDATTLALLVGDYYGSRQILLVENPFE